MWNLASELQVSDFTPAELAVINKHMEANSNISFADMKDARRDEDGNLIVSYLKYGRWYHYNPKRGEWW